jgi:hypothetical protein
MRIKRFNAAIGAGTVVLVLATTISAARAYEVDAAHQSTSSISAQTLRALKAQWRVEAKGYTVMKARAQELQALRASAWYADAQHYGWVR